VATIAVGPLGEPPKRDVSSHRAAIHARRIQGPAAAGVARLEAALKSQESANIIGTSSPLPVFSPGTSLPGRRRPSVMPIAPMGEPSRTDAEREWAAALEAERHQRNLARRRVAVWVDLANESVASRAPRAFTLEDYEVL
jgi:hypothetical protein